MLDLDKRCTGRIQPNLPVAEYKQRRCLGRYIIRDIDLVGMFVEGIEIQVRPHDIVDLVFLANGAKDCSEPMHATVIRRAIDGVDLIFPDENDSVAAAVQPPILAVK